MPGSIPPMGIPGQHKTVVLLKMGDTENDWLQSNISEKRSAWCLDALRRPGVHMGTKRCTGPVRQRGKVMTNNLAFTLKAVVSYRQSHQGFRRQDN